ncbi:unnamed protein product [Rhizopus microsporus]
MSNIYALEPHTNAKVILYTTAGDIEIELWGKEAPRASRNFIQLCLEGYYDNTIFHRIIPGFLVQGGDPTGTGQGGELSMKTISRPISLTFTVQSTWTRRCRQHRTKRQWISVFYHTRSS